MPADHHPSFRPRNPIRWLKPLLFVVCLFPLAYLVTGGLSNRLGANPIEAVIHANGEWALRFLLITLCITPLRELSGWGWLMQLRRMFGLFAFFYAFLHLGSYIGLDQFFDWRAIGEDIIKRPYITIGMLSFILLVPLAATSTNAMMGRLGGRRWQGLHRLIYVITLGACVHFLMLVKADILEPMIYLLLFGLLMAFRLNVWMGRKRGK